MSAGPHNLFPDELVAAVTKVEQEQGYKFYITGGTVRDWLLGRVPADLDITVKEGAELCCRELIRQLGGGAFVMLGIDSEEAARVVWRGNAVDFSAFRKNAQTIKQDLALRDFSINAMAIQFSGSKENENVQIIDPLDGKKDLEAGILRCCPGAFVNDPLRMLRGYRLCAELGFDFDMRSSAEIKKRSNLIANSAAERIHYELDRIMMTGQAADTFKEMSGSTLLWQIFPELQDGLGMEQPGFHHEDVFHHNLLALRCVDKVIERPQNYFSDFHQSVVDYLLDVKRKKWVRWAAFFHDLGKPATYSSGTIKPEKITFYNHDQVGREIFLKIAARLRWSKEDTVVVSKLIELHMHPFHLCNVRRQETVSRKACLKICKKAGDDLPGLFVVAMADSLAGKGKLKPENMEEELAQLFDEVQSANETFIQPMLKGRRLLSGHDLIENFNLAPGPIFSAIFKELEIVVVEEKVQTKSEALTWVDEYLANRKKIEVNDC